MPSRSRLYRTEAVVLRRLDLGEADRLLTVFTPDHGKLRLVAKGVRRPSSRKAGHLEPFTRADLLLARGRELDIITQAQALDQFPQLRDDLLRLGMASYVAELLDRFAVQEENRQLYDLLVETLGRVSRGADARLAVRYFELRLLDLVGFRPELLRCLGCGETVQPEDQFFSAEQGGVLCPRCGRGREEARRLSLPALKVLRHLQRSPYEAIEKLQLREAVYTELEALMEWYLTYLLERRLNAPAFLRHIRHLDVTHPRPDRDPAA